MTVREFQKQIDDKHDACRVDQRVRISAEVGGLMAQQYCPAGVVVPQRVRQIERAGGYCEDKAEAKYQCGHARSLPGIPEIRRRDLPKTEYLAGTGRRRGKPHRFPPMRYRIADLSGLVCGNLGNDSP
jgi:hypothetical protein